MGLCAYLEACQEGGLLSSSGTETFQEGKREKRVLWRGKERNFLGKKGGGVGEKVGQKKPSSASKGEYFKWLLIVRRKI